MKLVMALFLGMGLVIFRGLAALGMALLVFGPHLKTAVKVRQAPEKSPAVTMVIA